MKGAAPSWRPTVACHALRNSKVWKGVASVDSDSSARQTGSAAAIERRTSTREMRLVPLCESAAWNAATMVIAGPYFRDFLLNEALADLIQTNVNKE